MGELPREIAVIFDFDDTLADDSTAGFVKSMGLNPQSDFYDESARRVAQGWDPPLAYLSLLCELVQKGKLSPVKKSDFVKFGSKIKLYSGVQKFLGDLRKSFENDQQIKEARLVLSYYIVSGGIGDILRSMPIAKMFKEIWACEFDYDAKGVVIRPKAVISFTEKTKFLFLSTKALAGKRVDRLPMRSTWI